MCRPNRKDRRENSFVEEFVHAVVMVVWDGMDWLERFFDCLAKEPCRGCNKYVDHLAARTLCSRCWEAVWSQAPTLEQFPLAMHFMWLSAAVTYEGTVRQLIHKMKYEDDRLVSQDLAVLLGKALQALVKAGCERSRYRSGRVAPELPDSLADLSEALLVPVPLSAFRHWQRGFNHAEVLARRLGKTVGLRVSARALGRKKNTRVQHSLTRCQRKENLKDAFEANVEIVLGRDIILVDDVCTSGATLESAAQTLIAAGARSVHAVVVSRAQLD